MSPRMPDESVHPRLQSDAVRPLNFTVRAHVNAPVSPRTVPVTLLTLALLSGCAASSSHTLPKYQPPPSGAPAAGPQLHR